MTSEHLSSDPSDTPKTDAALIPYAGGHVVPADFARAQERRITELMETMKLRGVEFRHMSWCKCRHNIFGCDCGYAAIQKVIES